MKFFNLHARCQEEKERLRRFLIESEEKNNWLGQSIQELREELEKQRLNLIEERTKKPKRGRPKKSTSQDSDFRISIES